MEENNTPSFRSQFVVKRTYNRPLDEDGTVFETFEQTIDRVIRHQTWLWEKAKGSAIGEELVFLNEDENKELQELKSLLMNRQAAVSGRTMWLGGTDISKQYQATNFNCAFGQVRTVHDLVDAFHNLLLGVGVGFEPITGIINGFVKEVEIEVVRSTRKDRGNDNNKELFYKLDGKKVWRLVIGDSGIAWAKAAGKLVAMKKSVDVVILDFSEVRPGGKPLRGFGWISSGDEQISEAFYEIAKILNRRSGQLLSRMDILDVLNWLGTALSSRRSAEIALFPAEDPEAEEFAVAKRDHWKNGNKQRSQSNNSLVFYSRPSKREIRGLISQMIESGGSEPGFLNGRAALKRAPWFKGVNPCCVSGDTLVLTDKGEFPIVDLVGKIVNIWNGEEWSQVAPFKTGVNTIIRVMLSNGKFINCTADHRFILSGGRSSTAGTLQIGEELQQFYLPDGSKTEAAFVKSVERVCGFMQTYCFNDRLNGSGTFNGVVTGNCEILLGDKSYCNLVTLNLSKFNGKEEQLHRAAWIMGRANYRQTCVDLRDGILQETWHELNQFLRLTGVGCAGIVMWEGHKNPEMIKSLREVSQSGVHSMADELGLPRSKAITTVKPDGTVGKMMDTTEGIHKPLSKYIFNNILISKASPLLQVAIEAGYRHFEHPFDSTSEIVTLPVCFEGVEFDKVHIKRKVKTILPSTLDGECTDVFEELDLEVNLESAVDQLERYKLWMNNYADHNVSITVSYSIDESEEIVEWLHKNWDHFVGVSFLLRADPTKTAEDLGYAYLPQQPVTKDEYYEYVSTLKQVNLDNVFVNSLEELESDCSSGVCPIR